MATKTSTASASVSASSASAKREFFGVLLDDCINGKFGPRAQQYYVSAVSYHRKQKTMFPRMVTAKARAELTLARVQEVIGLAAKGVLPAGLRDGQAVFDLMMSNAKKSSVKAK